MTPFIVAGAIAALVFTSDVKAAVFVAENNAGGEIVLTDRPCVFKNETYDGLFEAYVWGPKAPMEQGCWTMVDKMVHIVFQNKGDRRVYDPNIFRKK